MTRRPTEKLCVSETMVMLVNEHAHQIAERTSRAARSSATNWQPRAWI